MSKQQPSADGLDLARALTRSTAAWTGRRKQRSPKRRANTVTFSGSSADDRDPHLLSEAVNRVVDENGWQRSLHQQGIFSRWEAIVGVEVAAHCVPTQLDETKLTVRADSTAWATQLKLLAPQMVHRINEELGPGSVTFVDILAPGAPSWRKGLRAIRDGRGPRDTYG
jgi:predicted nucleic acid-binding Zn ribbon protein